MRNSTGANTFAIFWSQTRVLTVSNLKARYRKTVAGFVWVVLNPLMIFGAQSYAFSKVLKIQLENYPRFLLAGLLPWIFVTQSLEMCTSMFVSSGRLLKSFSMHPLVFLFAQLLDNLINFSAAFLLILVPLMFLNPGGPLIQASSGWLLPLAILPLLVGTLGLAWLLATLQVFFRDTRFLVSFAINVAFFLTPIFYPMDFVPERFRWLVSFNPIFKMIQPFQLLIYRSDAYSLTKALVASMAVAVISVVIAAVFWLKKRNDVYLNI